MHLGRNICKVRELLNVKQQTLADLLKISQQTISRIEQSEYINHRSVKRIADALGVDVGLILHFDEKKIINCLSASGIISQDSNIPSTQLQLVEKIIQLYERLLEAESKIAKFPSR